MMHTNLNVKINVQPDIIVQILEKHKARHIDDYTKAVKVYLDDVEIAANKVLRSVSEGKINDNHTINLPKPIDNTKLYDKYIGMFSMTVDEQVELNSEDYGCLVDDNWDWSVGASAVNARYSSKF